MIKYSNFKVKKEAKMEFDSKNQYSKFHFLQNQTTTFVVWWWILFGFSTSKKIKDIFSVFDLYNTPIFEYFVIRFCLFWKIILHLVPKPFNSSNNTCFGPPTMQNVRNQTKYSRHASDFSKHAPSKHQWISLFSHQVFGFRVYAASSDIEDLVMEVHNLTP